MRVGILGAGVSGMTAAWLLQRDHEVTLIDASPKLGGHADTLPVVLDGVTVHAELGTRFFFDSAYPFFMGLLRILEVPVRWNDARVSFTDLARSRTIVLPPASVRELCSLASSPRLLRHVLSLRRLVAEQPVIASQRDFSTTFRRHLECGRYPASFGPEFAFPFLAACWGAPLERLPDFPVYSLLKGMPLGTAPGFYEIVGGMSRYMAAFGRQLRQVHLRLATRAVGIAHDGDFVVQATDGAHLRFDHLIVATSSRDAAALLRGVPAAAAMREAVGSFRHFETEIVVHGDRALMPVDERDWAHTNIFKDVDTAWMTDWQGLGDRLPVFRTWLPKGRPPPSPRYGGRSFHHLIMTPENAVLQRRIATLQGASGLWVTGMYAADVDNHESALLSALAPARALAPGSANLARLLGAVAKGAAHGLEVLPAPFPRGTRHEGARAP
jgi:predicted NAD/FAD-binding protein